MGEDKHKEHKKKPKTFLGKVWYFVWEDDSVLSWIVNIVIAFVLIKFIIYPGLGLVLGTTHPVVAVVSGSMEHKTVPFCSNKQYVNNKSICVENKYEICGRRFDVSQNVNLNFFWDTCGSFYADYNISKDDFAKYSFKNGFNTGDIIVLLGRKPADIKVGDVIVFRSDAPDPIIHRIVRKWQDNGIYHFQTKGDHNPTSINSINPPLNEWDIPQDRVIGKAYFKIPLLGYIKIWFVDLLRLLKLNTLLRLF